MSTCYRMVLLRVPKHPFFDGVDDRLWDEYVQFILGRDVIGWAVKNIDGSTLFSAPWSVK